MHRWILSAAIVAAGLVALAAVSASAADDKALHLFILSGQSNMGGLDPNRTFTPAVSEAYGAEHVIVVKDAMGGQPIRRWYKKWKAEGADKPDQIGDLYDRLMTKVKAAVGDRKPTSVTFVWMQGERDAKEKRGDVYAAALAGLIRQLRDDLGRDDVNFVIGRLSDNGKSPDWEAVRRAQVEVAEADARGAWVDTDDLNGEKDDLHYTKDGYDELGRRFAAKAIERIAADAER